LEAHRTFIVTLGHSRPLAERVTQPERRNRPSSSVGSVPGVDHSVVGAPTAQRRKCKDRNASESGGRSLLVPAVRTGGVLGALKQTVAFGTVDLFGDESPMDAAAVQLYDGIRLNVVVPSRISGFTEV